MHVSTINSCAQLSFVTALCINVTLLLTRMNVNMAEMFLTLGFDAGECRLRKLVSVLWSADITTLEDFRGLRR